MTIWDITLEKLSKGQQEKEKIDLIGDFNF